MTVTAQDVAAALRERCPALPSLKLHRLLYYCQGHHLAGTGEPLFTESISAWDVGPVVGQLWHAEDQPTAAQTRAPLGEAELNTVGYVVSRYGSLSGRDLMHLTHSESPWRLADRHRTPGESARIELAWIRQEFSERGAEEDEHRLDPSAVSGWLAAAEQRTLPGPHPDDSAVLRVKLEQARARTGA